jgi:hypothetical protein
MRRVLAVRLTAPFRPAPFRSAVNLGLIAALASLSLGACSSLGQVVGGSKVAPDEFRIVTKPTLAKPPEYNVRPRPPGAALPQVLVSDVSANDTFGVTTGQNASAGEIIFVRKAGAAVVNRNVRSQIDYEASEIVRKPSGLADAILFWRDDAPVDDNEEARATARSIVTATGGGDVLIERKTDQRFKLPGL